MTVWVRGEAKEIAALRSENLDYPDDLSLDEPAPVPITQDDNAVQEMVAQLIPCGRAYWYPATTRDGEFVLRKGTNDRFETAKIMADGHRGFAERPAGPEDDYDVEERAAILEYDAGMPRADAECAAMLPRRAGRELRVVV